MTQLINQDPLGLPVTLSGGGVLAFGEQGDGDPNDPHDASLIEAGVLARTESLEDLKKLAADLGIEGRSRMNRDELATAVAVAERTKAAEAAGTDNANTEGNA